MAVGERNEFKELNDKLNTANLLLLQTECTVGKYRIKKLTYCHPEILVWAGPQVFKLQRDEIDRFLHKLVLH